MECDHESAHESVTNFVWRRKVLLFDWVLTLSFHVCVAKSFHMQIYSPAVFQYSSTL